MPNIPPLASSVVKSKYFAGATLLLTWFALIFTLPEPVLTTANAGLAGYFIGTKIAQAAKWWEAKHEA